MKRTCPDEETIAAYIEGLLPEHERPRMEAHLSECDTCLDELNLTTSIVRGGNRFDTDMVPKVTRSAVRLVNSQVSISNCSVDEKIRRSVRGLHSRLLDYLRFPVRGGWQLAPIRGSKKAVSADLFHIRKSFREFDTDIEIEKTGENKAHLRIRLTEHNGHKDEIRATLKKGEREFYSALSSGGRVLFEDISFGPYTLIFARNGASLGAYPFEIKESGNGKK